MIRFSVPGIPRPGGSKRAFLHPKTRQIIVKDDAKQNREWRATVADFAQRAFSGDPLAGILRLTVVFTMPRPKNHYRVNGDLKPTAPIYHANRPDATKLLRSTEDALTGLIWRDDAQIAEQVVRKIYGEKPGAEITVAGVYEQVVDLALIRPLSTRT